MNVALVSCATVSSWFQRAFRTATLAFGALFVFRLVSSPSTSGNIVRHGEGLSASSASAKRFSYTKQIVNTKMKRQNSFFTINSVLS